MMKFLFAVVLCFTLYSTLAAKVPKMKSVKKDAKTMSVRQSDDFCTMPIYFNAGTCVCFLLFSGQITTPDFELTRTGCLIGLTEEQYLQMGSSCDEFQVDGGLVDLDTLENIIDFFAPVCVDPNTPAADYQYLYDYQ